MRKRWITSLLLCFLFVASLAQAHAVPIIGQGRWDRDAIAYFARVQADGGVIISDVDVNNAIKHAKQYGYWSSVTFWTSAQFGVKKDGSNAVSKLYCLKGNDAAQTTGSAQPIWTANQHNGRAGVVFDGASHYMTHAIDNSNAQYTAVAVASRTGGLGYNTIFCAGNIIFLSRFATSENWGTYVTLSSSISSSSILNVPTIMSVALRAADDFDLVTNGTVETRNTGTFFYAADRTRLGSSNSTYPELHTGPIHEVVYMKNYVASATIRAAIESFQNQKWTIY